MSEKVKIDKGIPVPEARGMMRRYPWSEMEIDDSFLLKSDVKSNSSHVSLANKRYAPKRFTSRRLSDGSRRIWRIE